MNRKTKVLIVDDSALVRKAISGILETGGSFEIIGAAADPFIAADILKKDIPDVIILDIEMPRMDGLSFLKKIMTQHPIPVVICSSLTGEGSGAAIMAMELGAIDIITKPKIGIKSFIDESRILICDTVMAAASVNIDSLRNRSRLRTRKAVTGKFSADVILSRPSGRPVLRTTDQIVVIGASTGGVEALRVFLQSVPMDFPGTVIVQHMPENFTQSFSERLNNTCSLEVKEAVNGDKVSSGRALIAPGNRHVMIKRSGARYYVEVTNGPLVCRHRPSVDVLFRSAAKWAGHNAIGIIMTGMGDDGAEGLLEMRKSGALTMGQDKATSVVFGMPGEAIKRGAVSMVLPLEELSRAVINEYSMRN